MLSRGCPPSNTVTPYPLVRFTLVVGCQSCVTFDFYYLYIFKNLKTALDTRNII